MRGLPGRCGLLACSFRQLLVHLNPRITIRSAEVGDVDAIVRLSAQLGYPVAATDVADRLEAATASEGHAVLVAEAAGDVAGWIHVHDSLLIQTPPGAELGGIVVDEGNRGAGIGRALLTAAEEWARSRGHRTMRIRSRTTRHDAHRFYTNAGYDETKTSLVFEKRLG